MSRMEATSIVLRQSQPRLLRGGNAQSLIPLLVPQTKILQLPQALHPLESSESIPIEEQRAQLACESHVERRKLVVRRLEHAQLRQRGRRERREEVVVCKASVECAVRRGRTKVEMDELLQMGERVQLGERVATQIQALQSCPAIISARHTLTRERLTTWSC